MEDTVVADAVQQGHVARVLVRASADMAADPGASGDVAFLFAEPVLPTHVPWEVLRDIAGQTERWTGVVARVASGQGVVDSSPLWTTGSNCLGLTLPPR